MNILIDTSVWIDFFKKRPKEDLHRIDEFFFGILKLYGLNWGKWRKSHTKRESPLQVLLTE